MITKRISLKQFVEEHVNFDALQANTTIKQEAARLLEAAKAAGIKSTLGSVGQCVSMAYKAHRKAEKKAASKKNGRSLAKDEIMRLARIGAETDLAFHLRMVETLRIFLKGVD